MAIVTDEEPFTVLDTPTIKIIDLKNGTSDVVLKDREIEMNVANSELLSMLRNNSRQKFPTIAYKHLN